MGLTLPSLPSGILSFVDTSPSLFYPPSAAARKARRRSQSFYDPETPLRATSTSPSRPTHRRSQSALPGSLTTLPSAFNTTSPLEASPFRPSSHKRSQSVMSLPVLAETPVAWATEEQQAPISSPAQSFSLDDATSKFSRLGLSSCSSVPPPQRTTHAVVTSGSSAPRPRRPPSSPKAATATTTLARPKHLTHSRRNSEASVSDLNVLATWSFPDVNSAQERGRLPSKHVGSDGLRQRLRTLSALDTRSLPPSSSVLAHLAPTSCRPSTPPSLQASLRTSLSSHCRTYSSPTPRRAGDESMPPPPLPLASDRKAPGPMLPPPPRPVRRPTTSRLRQPTQLVMSQERPSLVSRRSSQSLNLSLSSSPGSLMSDTSSTRSPTPSVVSLPGQTEARASKEREAWWGSGTPWKGPSRWRRQSIDATSIHSTGTEPDPRMSEIFRADELEDDDDDQEDMFLTMDDA